MRVAGVAEMGRARSSLWPLGVGPGRGLARARGWQASASRFTTSPAYGDPKVSRASPRSGPDDRRRTVTQEKMAPGEAAPHLLEFRGPKPKVGPSRWAAARNAGGPFPNLQHDAAGGVDKVVPVDVYVFGVPAAPEALLYGPDGAAGTTDSQGRHGAPQGRTPMSGRTAKADSTAKGSHVNWAKGRRDADDHLPKFLKDHLPSSKLVKGRWADRMKYTPQAGVHVPVLAGGGAGAAIPRCAAAWQTRARHRRADLTSADPGDKGRVPPIWRRLASAAPRRPGQKIKASGYSTFNPVACCSFLRIVAPEVWAPTKKPTQGADHERGLRLVGATAPDTHKSVPASARLL